MKHENFSRELLGGCFVPPNYQDWHNTRWSDSRYKDEEKLQSVKQRRHLETVFDTKVSTVSFDAVDSAEQWLLSDKKHFEQHYLDVASKAMAKKRRRLERKANPKVCKPFDRSLVTKWL